MRVRLILSALSTNAVAPTAANAEAVRRIALPEIAAHACQKQPLVATALTKQAVHRRGLAAGQVQSLGRAGSDLQAGDVIAKRRSEKLKVETPVTERAAPTPATSDSGGS